MSTPLLSPTEYAVLGVLASRPTHGFAIARAMEPDTRIGRILTVRRPLVYRALARLVEFGLAEPVLEEPGDAGPNRTVHQITRRGRDLLRSWLGRPVDHVRDIRIEFLLKVALTRALGGSPSRLISRQRSTLAGTLHALDETGPADHVELWRRHNAAAAAGYLEDLAARYPD